LEVEALHDESKYLTGMDRMDRMKRFQTSNLKFQIFNPRSFYPAHPVHHC